jgi:hypothetical protein
MGVDDKSWWSALQLPVVENGQGVHIWLDHERKRRKYAN